LAGYRALQRLGLGSTGRGAAATIVAYRLYKWLFEGSIVHRLSSLLRPGDIAVDVGANVGFFTRAFAQAVGRGGRVIALEPEPRNFAALRRSVGRFGQVELLEAAAADFNGSAKLALNPANPADHRLAADGICVKAVRLDDLMAERGWPEVALIKIDVQGAEPQVIAGACEVIERFRPALFIEVDIETSADGGRAIAALLRDLTERGYAGRRLARDAKGPLSVDEMLACARERGYEDFLLEARRASRC
jgi:FkbM family methyltransferase